MRLRKSLTVLAATALGTVTFAGFAGAASATSACVPNSTSIAYVCVSANPHLNDTDPTSPGTGVSTAESVMVNVSGRIAVCVGRVEAGYNLSTGPDLTVSSPVVRDCTAG